MKRAKIVKLINESISFNLRLLYEDAEKQIVYNGNVATVTINNRLGIEQSFGFQLEDIGDFEVFTKELELALDEVSDGCSFTVSMLHPEKGYIYKEKGQSKEYTEMSELRDVLYEAFEMFDKLQCDNC